MKRKFFLIITFLVSINLINAQWTNVNSIFTTDVTSLVNQGGAIIAGTSSKGIFKSIDQGETWKKAYSGLTGLEINCLVNAGGSIFAGTQFNGIQKYNGATWTPVNVCNEFTVTALGFCGTSIYAGINNTIYASADTGKTWKKVKEFVRDTTVTSFAFYCCTVFAGTNNAGVFVSVDLGNKWDQINNGLVTRSINCLIENKSVLYAGTDIGVFSYQATNLKNNWFNTGLLTLPVSSLGFYQDELWAGTKNFGAYKFDGETWTRVNNQIKDKYITSILSFGNKMYLGSKLFGVFSTDDGGTTFTQSRNGLIDQIRDVAVDETKIFILSNDDRGIFQSSNNGTKWTSVNKGLNNSSGLIFIANYDSLLYVGGINGIYKTPTASVNWSYGGISTATRSLLVDKSNVYTGSTDKSGRTNVYYSNNGGANWKTSYAIGFGSVNSFVKVDNRLFGGHPSIGVLESQDDGATWKENNKGFDIGKTCVWKLAVSDKYIFASTNNGVYRALKTDSVLSWELKNNFGTDVYDLLALKNNIFVVPFGKSVYSSNDYGETWLALNVGLTDQNIISIAANSTNLFCVSLYGGIWKRPLSEVTWVENESLSFPKNYYLQQNYPNPFNPATTIKYSIPVVEKRHASSLHVSLKVYDLLGKEVATLVNEEKLPGNYEIRFTTETLHATSLPSGVYFYRLTADKFSETKKMLLIK